MLLIICRSGACGLPGERHGFPSSLWYVTSREPTYVAVLVYVHWPLIISGIPQSIQLSLLLYQTIFYGEIAFPLCMSGVITVSITGRIALVRGKHIKLMGLYMAHPLTETILPLRSNQHRQFLHFEHLMLIESFALKSAWLFDQLIVNLTARNAVTLAVNMIFHNTQPFVQLLAYLLVVHRVTTRRGWKEDTEGKLTTLQWNRNRVETTQISTQVSVPITHEEF